MQRVGCFMISIIFIFCSLTSWKSFLWLILPRQYMLPSIFWSSTVLLRFGHGWGISVQDLSNWEFRFHLAFPNSGSFFPPPAAAAFFCPCSLCWELPLHVCHGQASVCRGWKPHRWRNRPEHGAGNGRVSDRPLRHIHDIDVWQLRRIIIIIRLFFFFFKCYSGPLYWYTLSVWEWVSLSL